MKAPVYAKMAVIGCGLIGSSVILAARGLIVRGVGNYGLPDHLRITIGLEEHNRAVVDALSAFLQD